MRQCDGVVQQRMLCMIGRDPVPQEVYCCPLNYSLNLPSSGTMMAGRSRQAIGEDANAILKVELSWTPRRKKGQYRDKVWHYRCQLTCVDSEHFPAIPFRLVPALLPRALPNWA